MLLALRLTGHRAAASPPVDELVIADVSVMNVDQGETEPHQNVVMREGFDVSVGRWLMKKSGPELPVLFAGCARNALRFSR
ncbi:hypothetical protein [Hymenobacter daeguensis]